MNIVNLAKRSARKRYLGSKIYTSIITIRTNILKKVLFKNLVIVIEAKNEYIVNVVFFLLIN